MYSKRFPEDERVDNYETGQLSSWGIIGLKVPDINIFIDNKHAKALTNKDDNVDTLYDARDADSDVKYEVPSTRSIMTINKELAIPFTHSKLEEYPDWDVHKDDDEGYLKRLWQLCKQCITGRIRYSPVNNADTHAVFEENSRKIRWKICKFAEILLSPEIVQNCANMEWDITTFADMNKLSSAEQGRLSQNLAMVCNLNPPPRFTRFSEWTLGVAINVFDEHINVDEDMEKLHVAHKTVLNVVGAGEYAATAVTSVVTGSFLTYNLLRNGESRVLPGKRHKAKSINDIHDPLTGGSTEPLNDRIIQYLAECMVSSSSLLDLSDQELSVYARYAYRAMMRALRRQNMTFVLPSVFMGPKQINILHLNLSKNELDDGDCVLLADALLYQINIEFLDVSFNRIGARGFGRMCKILADNNMVIKTIIANHNRIGPTCGDCIAQLLRSSKSIKVLDISYNRLGELIRYSTLVARERVPSAAKEIFYFGLKNNISLQLLDLSYNNLGPDVVNYISISVNKHPMLRSLALSGNGLGSRGAALLYCLAGEPGGDITMIDTIKLWKELRNAAASGVDLLAELKKEEEEAKEEQEQQVTLSSTTTPSSSPSKKSKSPSKSILKSPNKSKNSALNKFMKTTTAADNDDEQTNVNRICQLTHLALADNQMGYLAGYGISALLHKNKNLTALDVSGNSIGPVGGVAISDGLEHIFNITPRDLFKQTLLSIEERKYTGRHAIKRPKLYTTMVSLNLAHNGLGPEAVSGLMICMAHPLWSITDLNISSNPIGNSVSKSNSLAQSMLDIRIGVGGVKTLIKLGISNISLSPAYAVTFLGGLNTNPYLMHLILDNIHLDEPCCLQLAHAIRSCTSLHHMSMENCRLGPAGSIMIVNKIDESCERFNYVNLSGNKSGPTVGPALARLISNPLSSIKTLYIGNNEYMEDAGLLIAKAMGDNTVIEEIDLSGNLFTAAVGYELASSLRDIYENGIKVRGSSIRKLILNDNPKIGAASGKRLVSSMIHSSSFKYIGLSNIGIGHSSSKMISKALRTTQLTWQYVDLSNNNFSRSGLNDIFWGLRLNRSIRVLDLTDNKGGPFFSTPTDTILRHGIALQRALLANVVLRDLNLSWNGMSSKAGIVLFETLVDNHSIRRLVLRGNLFDDDIAGALRDFLVLNNVVEYLDLGGNQLGYNCCFTFAEGIEVNRSVKQLFLDSNKLRDAGDSTAEAFSRALMMNHRMTVLSLESNHLGPNWGVMLASAISRNNTLINLNMKGTYLYSLVYTNAVFTHSLTHLLTHSLDNRLDARSGQHLVNSYKHAPFLLELALSKDEVSADVWNQYIETYNNKRAIVEGDPSTYGVKFNDTSLHSSAHEHLFMKDYE